MIEKGIGQIANAIFNVAYSITPSGYGALAITIVMVTIIIKIFLLPLAVKQYIGTKKMQKLQPEVKKIQEKYKDKKDMESQQKMGQELQDMYKQHNAHPLSGCLPAIIQLPIIFAMFAVLRDSNVYISKINEVYLNIVNKVMLIPNYSETLKELYITKTGVKDLAKMPDFSKADGVRKFINNLTDSDWNNILLNSNVSDNIHSLLVQKNGLESIFTINLIQSPGLVFPAVIIPILAAVTMFISTKLAQGNVKDMDEQTARMTKSMGTTMPIVVFIFSLSMPNGLGIYFLTSNIFQIIQQKCIEKFIKTE